MRSRISAALLAALAAFSIGAASCEVEDDDNGPVIVDEDEDVDIEESP